MGQRERHRWQAGGAEVIEIFAAARVTGKSERVSYTFREPDAE